MDPQPSLLATVRRERWRIAGVVGLVVVLVFALVPALRPAAGFAAVLLTGLLLGTLLPPRPSAVVVSPPEPAVTQDAAMRALLGALPMPGILASAEALVLALNAAAAGRFGGLRAGEPILMPLRVPEITEAIGRVGRGGPEESVRFVERVPVEHVFVATIRRVRLGAADDPVLVLLEDRTENVRLDRMRSDFVANASHELRTPLASLTAFIETLLGPARDDAAGRERFLGIMRSEAERMARLIDDLLSLSRLEMRESLRPGDRTDLGAVARAVADALAPLAAASSTAIEAPGGSFPVRGDHDELLQLLTNLVENAVKYGRTGGRVTVTIAPETGPDGIPGFWLAVADDGPGIEAQHLPRLTERFYRVDASRSRAQKGTGLGLAIVKHIVARHRGRLSIRSEPGSGTVVTAWLPAAERASP